jgi:hypothetical protein
VSASEVSRNRSIENFFFQAYGTWHTLTISRAISLEEKSYVETKRFFLEWSYVNSDLNKKYINKYYALCSISNFTKKNVYVHYNNNWALYIFSFIFFFFKYKIYISQKCVHVNW